MNRQLIVAMIATAWVSAGPTEASAQYLVFWAKQADLARRLHAAGVTVRPFSMNSIMMVPTLVEGAIVVVDTRPQAGRLRRGDMVAFNGPEQDLIRRVVGLPGDSVGFRGGHLVLNGANVVGECRDEQGYGIFCDETPPEGFGYTTMATVTGPKPADLEPQTVPKDHVLVASDLRVVATAGDFPEYYVVPNTRVEGRVLFRLGPEFTWLVDEKTIPGFSSSAGSDP